MKKKLIGIITMICFVVMMSVPALAENTVFRVSTTSYTGIASCKSSSSYYTVNYELYGSKKATKMSCQVAWTYATGGTTTSALDEKKSSSSMSGSKSNGPKNNYKTANVTFKATWNGYSNSSSAKAF